MWEWREAGGRTRGDKKRKSVGLCDFMFRAPYHTLPSVRGRRQRKFLIETPRVRCRNEKSSDHFELCLVVQCVRYANTVHTRERNFVSATMIAGCGVIRYRESMPHLTRFDWSECGSTWGASERECDRSGCGI